MKYCVIKNTTKVIDGSKNPQEIMLLNAINAGFTELEVEILAEDEFEARKALEPLLLHEPTTDELMMLAIADLDAQRVKDKLETQLAIAELTNTIIGGTVNG